jgi:TetR/AcrR family transcriptional regulator, transcriptional repressor for nem operon
VKRSKAEAAETRRRIVETAAREFRRNGIHATGLADLMAGAGLTQGGFYRHFQSKDQLVAEACAAAMNSIVARA